MRFVHRGEDPGFMQLDLRISDAILHVSIAPGEKGLARQNEDLRQQLES